MFLLGFELFMFLGEEDLEEDWVWEGFGVFLYMFIGFFVIIMFFLYVILSFIVI